MENYRYAMSKRGMVSSAHTLISSTGINILRNNGNAMDAAVSMALTASVVLPDMCGIGGDTFLLYFDKKSKSVYALNGSGPMGSAYNKDFFNKLGYNINPEHGILSISVPGSISALTQGLNRFGSMQFGDCAKDAIEYASNGFPIGKKTSEYISKKIDLIKNSKALSDIFLDQDNNAKSVHSVVKNEKLANTLRNISQNKEDYFYSELSKIFVPELNKLGANFTLEDFTNYKAEWVEPIKIKYRNHNIYQTPPVSQGIIHLEMLNILSNFDMTNYGRNSSDQIHTMVESKKLAFEDRIKYFGDPNFVINPVEQILSNEYCHQRSQLISKNESINIERNLLNHQGKHTTSLVVVDSHGNACSLITSISDAFGSGIMDDETGILWNNRIGTNANLIENHPNCVGSGKRTMNTLNTYMILDKDGNCRYLGNTPGGDNQPQWNAQMVVNLLDNKLNVLDSINQPMWYDSQSTNPFNKSIENILYIEKGISQNVVDELIQKGHNVKLIDRCNSAVQLIEIREDGVLCGATDHRAEGVVIGY